VAPDSVVHQYRGENFTTSTWPDTAPSGPQADMSINGVSASTLNGARAASSDGVDDFALADGPQTLPQNETFGVAFVIQKTSANSVTEALIDVAENSTFELLDLQNFDGSAGEVALLLTDSNGAPLNVEVDTAGTQITDGDTHLVCTNAETSQGASGIDFYVDDMTTPQPTTTINDGGFDNTSYSISEEAGFFARNNDGTTDRFTEFSSSFIEFNEERYSQQERLDLKQRAPGL
jgi:hypothetical protein